MVSKSVRNLIIIGLVIAAVGIGILVYSSQYRTEFQVGDSSVVISPEHIGIFNEDLGQLAILNLSREDAINYSKTKERMVKLGLVNETVAAQMCGAWIFKEDGKSGYVYTRNGDRYMESKMIEDKTVVDTNYKVREMVLEFEEGGASIKQVINTHFLRSISNGVVCGYRTVNRTVLDRTDIVYEECSDYERVENYGQFTLCLDNLYQGEMETISVPAGTYNTRIFIHLNGTRYWVSGTLIDEEEQGQWWIPDLDVPVKIVDGRYTYELNSLN